MPACFVDLNYPSASLIFIFTCLGYEAVICSHYKKLPVSLLCNCDYGNNSTYRTYSYWRPVDAVRCWPFPSTSASRQHTAASPCEQSDSSWARVVSRDLNKDVQTIWVPSFLSSTHRDVIQSWHLWRQGEWPTSIFYCCVSHYHKLTSFFVTAVSKA